MKPEEIDSLFRDELEKLEHLPDLEWSDEAAWEKINTNMQGGWSNLWVGPIIAAVVVGVYMIYTLFTKETLVAPKQNLVEITVPVKKDTTQPVIEKEIVPVKKEKYQLKRKPVSPKIDTSIALVVLPEDTSKKVSGDVPTDTNRVNFRYRQYLNRYRMLNAPMKQAEPTFFMPNYTVLRMDVSSTYNFQNLLRSVAAERKAGDNFYYIYEYNKVASPTDMHRFPVAMPNNRQIITNFSR